MAVINVSDEEGQELAQALQGEGLVAKYWSLDVTDEEAIQRAFSKLSDRFGKIDVLVNNAGIAGGNKPIGEYRVKEWQ